MAKPAFPEEKMERLIEEWKEAGRPSYSTFHQKKKAEAEDRGETFTAASTFRKALVKKGLLPDSKKSHSESSTISEDPDYVEFLEAHLREDVKDNPKASYWEWKAKRLQERLKELEGQ